MITRAVQDLLHPDHSEEAMAWFNSTDANLTFQLCAHVLGFDEDVLRQAILQKSSAN